MRVTTAFGRSSRDDSHPVALSLRSASGLRCAGWSAPRYGDRSLSWEASRVSLMGWWAGLCVRWLGVADLPVVPPLSDA
jgi:hypothetical protein